MPRPQTASPAKSPKKGARQQQLTSADYEQMLADQAHQMQMQISEKEIEIERLKTTVVSLNQKCSIVNDHEDDVRVTTERLQESEQERSHLQDHMVKTSKKVEQDSKHHNQY